MPESEGVGSSDGVLVLSADSDKLFAEALLSLLRDAVFVGTRSFVSVTDAIAIVALMVTLTESDADVDGVGVADAETEVDSL